MITFILVRHGETAWTAQKRYQGNTDTELLSSAEKKIQRVAKEIEKYSPDVLYCSSLKRAKQTAVIIGKAIRKRPKIATSLRELNFGN